MKQTSMRAPPRPDSRRSRPRVGRFASLAVGAACMVAATPSLAKTPGQTYCFRGVCHRVLTVEETKRAVGRSETVIASFYDHPKRDAGNPNINTSSGERFDALSDRTAASPIYPNGTRLLVWNPRTKAAAEVRVNNSGPYHGARRLDVSRGAAERLGFRPVGVSQLNVTVLSAPTPEEALYKKGRIYAPAAGYLGTFESAERAFASANGHAGGPSHGTPSHGASSGVVAKAATPTQPITTSSIGWDTTVRPVRSPLQKAQPAATAAAVGATPRQRPMAPSHPATASATVTVPAHGVAQPGPAQSGPAWSATLLECSAASAPRLPSIMTAPTANGIVIRP